MFHSSEIYVLSQSANDARVEATDRRLTTIPSAYIVPFAHSNLSLFTPLSHYHQVPYTLEQLLIASSRFWKPRNSLCFRAVPVSIGSSLYIGDPLSSHDIERNSYKSYVTLTKRLRDIALLLYDLMVLDATNICLYKLYQNKSALSPNLIRLIS